MLGSQEAGSDEAPGPSGIQASQPQGAFVVFFPIGAHLCISVSN